jgi:hypothetical protein
VAPPLFEATQQDFSETMVEEPAHPMVAQAAEAAPTLNLQPGAWTEIYMDDRWVRTQLTWASPHGTLFMFTSADGVPHSMTRQSLDHLAAAGHLRLLADQAVVAGALDAVAQTAPAQHAGRQPLTPFAAHQLDVAAQCKKLVRIRQRHFDARDRLLQLIQLVAPLRGFVW